KLGHNFAAANILKPTLCKASDLVGTAIKNPRGQDLGTIAELLLDPEKGSIAYAVLSFEDKRRSDHTVFFALPWNIVRVNAVQRTFVADVNTNMAAKNRDVSHERFGSNSSTGAFERRGARTQKQ